MGNYGLRVADCGLRIEEPLGRLFSEIRVDWRLLAVKGIAD